MIQLVFLLFAFRGDQVGNNRWVGGIVAALLLTTASQDGAILLIVTPCLFFVSFSFLADSLRNRTNIYASKIKNVTNSWNCCATVCANCRKPIQPTPRITVPVPRYKSIMSISFTPFVFLPLSFLSSSCIMLPYILCTHYCALTVFQLSSAILIFMDVVCLLTFFSQDSSRGSLEDQPGSDDSLCRVGGGCTSEGKGVRGNSSVLSPSDATSQLDALYAEVDLSKKRQQRCASSSGLTVSTTSGGLGLSGPVNSLMQQRFPDVNRLSLSGLTRTVRDSRVDSGSVDMETPLSLSPKSPVAGLNDDQGCSHSSGSIGKKPIPPPRTRIPRKDSDNSVNEGNASDHSGSKSLSGSGGVAPLPGKGNCPSVGTLSGLSDAEMYESGATTALGELGHAIDQAIASMTAAASEHSDYDVPKPPRSLKVRLFSSFANSWSV